jgi:8-oxo-dGTP pyrophosphatase MutT (NUDIX family)
MWWRDPRHHENSKVTLVREFRSPASTDTGFIIELPGGSSPGEDDPAHVAAEEIQEEVGLYINPDRLKFHAARQLAGTLSAHRSHLFSVELDEEEIAWLESQKDVVHGNVDDSEQTYVELVTLKQLLAGDVAVDWSTLGMILSVSHNEN